MAVKVKMTTKKAARITEPPDPSSDVSNCYAAYTPLRARMQAAGVHGTELGRRTTYLSRPALRSGGDRDRPWPLNPNKFHKHRFDVAEMFGLVAGHNVIGGVLAPV